MKIFFIIFSVVFIFLVLIYILGGKNAVLEAFVQFFLEVIFKIISKIF